MAFTRSMKVTSNGASASMNPTVGVCSICDKSKKKEDYTTVQWKRFRNNGNCLPKCRDCQQKRNKDRSKKNPPDGSSSITRACSNCMAHKGKEHFFKQRWVAAGKGRTMGKCIECLTSDLSVDQRLLLLQQNEVKAAQTRACSNCMTHKEREHFYRKKWAAARKGLAEGKCIECLTSKLSVDQRLLHQNEAVAVQSGKKRSHNMDTAGLTKTKKPMLNTSEDEKAATESEGVDALQNAATVPDTAPSGEAVMTEVPSGTATAAVAVVQRFSTDAKARGRGIDNRPAWMTRGLHSAAAAISAPVAGRGRGRGIDNRPSWMTRGLGAGGDRLSEVVEAPQTVGEQRPSVSAALSAIPIPCVRDERSVVNMTRKPRVHTSEDEKAATESEGVDALQNAATVEAVMTEVPSGTATAAVAVVQRFSTDAKARGRGIDNRPAWMTRGLHSAAAAISAPVAGRGRGRGIDNRPSWMTRGLGAGGDRLSEVVEAPQTVGEQRPSVSAALSAIPIPCVRDERSVVNMTRKPRVHTSEDEKAATESEGVDALQNAATVEAVMTEVPSGTATAAVAVVQRFSTDAKARGRGIDNRPAWMTRGLHSAAAAISAPVAGRGRGRGIDNRPSWMTRGLGAGGVRLSEVVEAPQTVGEQRPSVSAALSAIPIPCVRDERSVVNMTRKPRVHTSEDEKAATESEGVDALQNAATVEAVMTEVPSGTATAAVAVVQRFSTDAKARGRGIDNRPAWMTRGLHSAAAAISAPVAGRGRGRGIDNRPSWMTRGLGAGGVRLSEVVEAPQTVGEQRPSVSAALSAIPIPCVRDERSVVNMTRSFATIDVPAEVYQQIAAQTAAVISGRGPGVENQPPSTTRIQIPVEVRVKHEVHVTHKVDIHAHHGTGAANKEAPNLPRATEEYYSFNQDGSVWV